MLTFVQNGTIGQYSEHVDRQKVQFGCQNETAQQYNGYRHRVNDRLEIQIKLVLTNLINHN